jgi:hypothetical protein
MTTHVDAPWHNTVSSKDLDCGAMYNLHESHGYKTPVYSKALSPEAADSSIGMNNAVEVPSTVVVWWAQG